MVETLEGLWDEGVEKAKQHHDQYVARYKNYHSDIELMETVGGKKMQVNGKATTEKRRRRKSQVLQIVHQIEEIEGRKMEERAMGIDTDKDKSELFREFEQIRGEADA